MIPIVTIKDIVPVVIPAIKKNNSVEEYLASISLSEIPGNGSIDVSWLLERLRAEPTHRHDLYCLGKGYMCLGDWPKAERWMRRRSDCGDGSEERWHAHYMMAVCQGRQGKHEHFTYNCLEAWQIRPTRAEPLYWLARHYRESQKYEAAFAMCDVGIKVPVPAGDSLSVEHSVYQWDLTDELSVAGNHCTGENYQRGKAACIHLAMNCPVKEIRDRARKNLDTYRKLERA